MRSEPVVSSLPEVDEFLHELVRLKLLSVLSVLKRADFVYLLRHCDISRGNLSVQMTKLSEAGLIDIQKSFVDNRPRTVYAITPQGRAALGAYKSAMTTLLETIPDQIDGP